MNRRPAAPALDAAPASATPGLSPLRGHSSSRLWVFSLMLLSLLGFLLPMAQAQTGQVRYYPVVGYESRMVGGQFQGSPDNSTWTTLYTISATPSDTWITAVTSADPGTFRYLRYLAPNGSYGNVAEIEFYSGTGASSVKLTGTPFGTAGSYNNDGYVFTKALDGSVSTYFNAPSPGNGDYVGFDQGTPAGEVRYFPRAGYESRMVGGQFQGSNDNSTWTTLSTVTTTPPDAWTQAPLTTDPKTFRYLRYLGPTSSYCDVAEIEFYTIANAKAVKLTGVGFGTAGSYNNSGNVFAQALDGNTGSYFDGPDASGDYVGIDQQGTQMTLTNAGIAAGFTLSTFATGFPQYQPSRIGPLGIVFPGNTVLVTDNPGHVRVFLSDADNQVAGSTSPSVVPTATYGQSNAIGLAAVGGVTYMAQQALNQVVRINPDGTPYTSNSLVASIPRVTGLAAYPATGQLAGEAGHLFATSNEPIGGSPAGAIYDVNPATNTATAWAVALDKPDGLSISADGSTLYVATNKNGSSDILAFSIANAGLTQTWDYNAVSGSTPIAQIDGTALGYGKYLNYIYANTNPGQLWQIALPGGTAPPGQATLIASGGTRGDFVAVDTSGQGSLLLTQSDRVLRLQPFPPPITILSLTLNPTTVNGTQSSIATATISSTAPTGGVVLQLSSSNPTASVPATVTVLTGNTVTFPVATIGVPSVTTSIIGASVNGTSASAVLTINAPTCTASPLLSVSVAPNGSTLQGTVTLQGNAQSGGQVVNLTCDTPSALNVPASVTVPFGSSSQTFTATPLPVFSSTPVVITAQYHGVIQQTTYVVAPAGGGASDATPGGGPGGYDTGGMTLTPTAIARGFQLRTFATFPNYPADCAVTSSGKVFVSGMLIYSGSSHILPSDTDGQDGSTAPALPNNVWAVTTIDGNSVYSSYGGISLLDQNGNVIAGSTYKVPVAEDIAVDPFDGHVITDALYDFDPVSHNASQIASGGGDGVAVTPDGQFVLVAGNPTAYPIAGGAAITFNNNGHSPDGMAAGSGVLAGKIYSNNPDGTISEYDLSNPAGVPVVIAYGGTRGDLAKVDQTNGTFLLSQGGSQTSLPRILRLIPPPGASFGAPAGKIVITRDDKLWQYAATLEVPPTPPDAALTISNPALTATTTKAAAFDLVGFSGALAQGEMERAGQVQYTTNGAFDLQWGLQALLAPGATTSPQTLSAAQTSVQLYPSDPHQYDVSWGLASDYLADVQNNLGADYRATLLDQISSTCGTYSIADTPHYSWPFARNVLTLLDSPNNARIEIPAGRCLDMTLPGSDVPDNNAHWDILLSGSVLASSGNPQGWDVEADHTLYHGITVTVPAGAAASSSFGAPISNSYEVRFQRQLPDDPYQSSGSSGFSVTQSDTTERAAILRPVTVTQDVNGKPQFTVTLDAPAPEGGAAVTLTSSSPYLVITGLGYVIIPAGGTIANFAFTTQAVSGVTHVQVLAAYNGYRTASLTLVNGGGTLPGQPALMAVPGNKVVFLSWAAATNTNSYTLLRSTHKGGPYTALFSGLTGTTYADKSVTNGTTYYYVAVAVNDYGSTQSPEVSATPSAGPAAAPTFGSTPSGFLSTNGSILAMLSDATPGATIHYTLDGSVPTQSSPVYSRALTLSTSATITAVAMKSGFAPSAASAQQYIVTNQYSLVLTSSPCGSTLPGTLSATDGWSLVQGTGFYGHDYTFSGRAGTTVTISVTGGGSPKLDTILFLMDHTGKVIAWNDDGPNPPDPQITITLPATDTYTAEVSTFAPGLTGSYTFSLNCNLPQLSVLNGQTALPTGSSVPFGSTAVGGSLSQTLTLQNTGSGELDLSQITLPTWCTLVQAPANPLQPTNTTSLVLSFVPTAAQPYSGPLTIASNDPASPYTLTLTGTGTTATAGGGVALSSLGLTPDPVIGGLSVTGTVTLTNTAPTGGFVVNLTKTPGTDTTVGLPNPAAVTVLSGHTTGTFTLTTTPVAASTTVTINAAAGAQTASVPLTLLPQTPLPAPAFTPPGQAFTAANPLPPVTISDALAGATIYYTTDGSTPTTASPVYSAPLTVTTTETLRAIAAAPNYLPSPVASATYTLLQPPTVILTSPTTGSQFTAGSPITLTALPTALSGNVTNVEFDASINGGTSTKIGQATASPYTFVWPGGTAGQTITFKAIVTDSNNLTGMSASVTVTVTGPVLASLQLAPDPVTGGGNVTGTVTLAAPAPPGGASVALTTSDSTHAPLTASSVTVPAGQLSTTFTITTTSVTASASALIGASCGGGSASVTLIITPLQSGAAPSLASLRLSPDPVLGGSSVVGTVTLTGPAPTGGAAVALTTSDSVHAPLTASSVTVPAGQLSTTFAITTASVTVQTNAAITAAYNGAPVPVTLVLTTAPPPALASLQLSPDPVPGGTSVTGTVTLASAAPAGGATVSLTTGDGVHAPLSSPSVLVPAGQLSATFTIATTSVTAQTGVSIGASCGSGSASVTLVITPGQTSGAVALASLQLSPDPVTGGQTSTGTVLLTGPAPAGGAVVMLTKAGDPGNAATLPTPASVMVPAGQAGATFLITTTGVTAPASAVITAAYSSSSVSGTLIINAPAAGNLPALTSLQLAPDPVTGGTAVTGTVTLASAAPAGGATVTLTKTGDTGSVVGLPSPATVIVPAGQTTATFTLTTLPVSAQISPSISAACGGGSASVTLVVNPPMLTSLTLFPSSVTGGQTASGTVTLTGPAPASMTFNLTKTPGTDTTVGLPSPATVTMPAGQTTGTFALTTAAVTVPASVAINACATGTTPAATATLTINPAAALTISCGQTLSGSLSTSDIVSTNPFFPGTGPHYAKRYTFTPTVSGNYTLTLTTTSFTPVLSLITGSGYSLTQVSAQETFPLVAQTPYAFEVSTNSAGQTGPFQLNLDCPQPGGAPLLGVSLGGTAIANNTSTPVSFGSTPVGLPVSQTFTLSNTGGSDLSISGVSIGGATADYTLLGTIPSLIPAGGQAPLTVQFNATQQETSSGIVTINSDSNGSATSTYVFPITAVATGPGTLPTITLSPLTSSVVGGSPQPETVTLSAAAPTGGLTVLLSVPASSASVASVPASVKMAAGQTTAPFSVTTSQVTAATPVTVTATLGTSTAQATVTVTANLACSVSLTAGPSPQPAPGTINLTATPTVTGGATVAMIEFFENGVKVGQDTASPYTYSWTGTPPGSGVPAGSYTLTAKITDSLGRTSISPSIAPVVVTATALSVAISPNGGSGLTSAQTVTLTATGGGNAVHGTQIYYSLNGKIWQTYTQPLTIVQTTTVSAVAVPPASSSYASGSASATFSFSTVLGGSLTAEITSPADSLTQAGSATISAPTAIQASISAPSTWQLSYRLDGDTTWVPFAANTNSAALSKAMLATWDTTLLVNGLYQVQLTAMDTSGHTATAQIEVLVQGGQKVGYFTLSYNDLTVPVAGFPLSVTRTYDSRVKTPGDFGVGWTLSTNNIRLQQSSISGYNWTTSTQGTTAYYNPVKPHLITITMPDGTTYNFQEGLFDTGFSVFEQSDVNSTTVTYTPQTGTHATLTPVGFGTDVLLASDTHSDDPNQNDPNCIELEDLGGDVYRPTEFILTTHDGRQFDVAAGSPQSGGGLQWIKDLNGNTVTFQHSGGLVTGITSTTGSGTAGPAITFQRTGPNAALPNNVITSIDVSISLPGGNTQTGPAITYGYGQDGTGDLKSVSDRVGNTTTYDYDPTHLLTGIHDPRGLTPLTNHYDAYGRLLYSTDANGNKILYTYDPNMLLPGNHTETTTDRLLNQTVLTYDGYGNVLGTSRYLSTGTNPHWITTSASYGYTTDPNNPDKKTQDIDALGRETDYAYDTLGNLTTVTQYRTKGDTTSAITTTTTYNSFGQPLTVTDPLGHVVSTNNYDPKGNLLWTRDALGHETDFSYNANGTLATTTDAKSNVTRYGYGDPNNPANVTSVTDAQGHATSFTYDLDGNKKSQTTTRLNSVTGLTDTLVTQFQYDADDHLTLTTAPDGATSQTFYTSLGKVDHTVDALGRITSYSYDNLGQLTGTTYPDTTSTSVGYDLDGQRISSMDKAGRISASVYDSLGRVIQSGPVSPTTPFLANGTPNWLTNGATALVSTTNYDDAGEVTSEVDALGHTSRTTYDNLGRTLTSTDALNNVTKYAYDDDGRQLSVTDAENHTTSYDYDDAGKLMVTHYPDGSTSSTGYDELGRRISQTDQANHTTLYGYDTLGRLASVMDALNHQTQFGYDALGEKISQTDANGHVTRFSYDLRGRLLSKTLPLGQSDGRTYDGLGRLSTQTDFNGTVTTFAYYPAPGLYAGLLQSKTASVGGTNTGESVSFTYNLDGTRATATRTALNGTSVQTSYGYYANGNYQQGQLNTVTTPLGTITYSYDTLGNKVSMVTPSGKTVGYGYDALNRLSTVTHPDNAVTTFGYDKVGNRQSVRRSVSGTAPAFSTTSYTYDSLNRLTDLVNKDGNSALVSSFHYQLRADGKRLSVTETDTAATSGLSGTTNYTYDAAGKLVEENGPYADIQYAYDNVGNRLTRTVVKVAGTGTTLVTGVTNSTYDANDRLTSGTHTYDNDGNEKTVAGQTAGYDFENHLVSLSSNNTVLVSYVYDADGNRYSVTAPNASNVQVTTTYAVDTSLPYASVVEEYTGTTPVLSARYDYGDELIRVDHGTTPSYYLFDGLGSTRQFVSTTGGVTDAWGYSAFGELAFRTGSTANPFLFNAQQFDTPSGDYYLRARYYDQSNGRFISQDPYSGSDETPVSLHRYLYASVDPVDMVDPTGQDDLGETVVTEAVGQTLDTISASAETAANTFARASIGAAFGGALGALQSAGRSFLTDGDVGSDTATGFAVGAAFGAITAVNPVLGGILAVYGGCQLVSTISDDLSSENYGLASYDIGTAVAAALAGGKLVKWAKPLSETMTGDVSTQPNKAQFWSGVPRDRAQIYAHLSGRTTVEMTSAGAPWEAFVEANKSDFFDVLIGKLGWNILSQRFAHATQGDAHVILGSGLRDASVWNQYEKPILNGKGATINTTTVGTEFDNQ